MEVRKHRKRPGLNQGICLLSDMDVYESRLEELVRNLEEKLAEIPYIDKLMEIKGSGLITVSGFIAGVGTLDVLIPPNNCKSWQDMQSWRMNRESITERAGSVTVTGNA